MKKYFLLECYKSRRTGIVPIILAAGAVGALYVLGTYAVRSDSLLALPMPPMTVLLTQLYGVVMLVNFLMLSIGSCNAFYLEHNGSAIKKMYLLPASIGRMFMAKLLLLLGLFFVAAVVQYAALTVAGLIWLPDGSFVLSELLQFAGYTFAASLPLLLLQLLIGFLTSNIWISLGAAVAGFFSGMATARLPHIIVSLNPYALIMQPAMAKSSAADPAKLCIALIETMVIIFLAHALCRNKKFE